MNNNILNKLYLYIENNKIIDDNFIYYSIQKLLKQYKLYNQVKNICVINNNDSYYSYYNKTIAINLKYEKELIKALIHILKKDLDNKSYISLINLLLLESIYHEIEHAKQYKLVKSNINNTEAKLLNLSFNYYIDKNTSEKKVNEYFNALNKEYNNQLDYYFCSPDERLAYIKSTNIIYKYSKLVQKNKIVIDYINYHWLENIVDEYEIKEDKIICPIKKFFDIRTAVAIDNNIEIIPFKELIDINKETKKYATAKKLLYGFPVCKNELDFYKKSFEKTKAYKLFN